MTDSPEILRAIKEILRLDSVIQAERVKIREIEKEQGRYRDLLKEHYDSNTVIKTSAGDITIREKTLDGKLSLEDIRDIFDTVDWIGDDTKNRLLSVIEESCETRRRYARTLTIKRGKSRKHNKTRKEKGRSKDDLKPSI